MSPDEIKRIENKIDNLRTDVMGEIKVLSDIMHGTDGEFGCLAKCKLTYDLMVRELKKNDSRLEWVFKIFVSILLTYIAVQIGLK